MEEHNDSDSDGGQEQDDNGDRPANSRNANNGLTAFLQNLRDRQQLPLQQAPSLPDQAPAEFQQSQSQTVSTQQSQQPGPSGLQSLINLQGIVGRANTISGSPRSSAGAMPSLTPVQPRPHAVFEISPSQDVFSSQDPMFEFSSALSHSSLQPGGTGHPQVPSSGSGHLQLSSSRNGPPQPSSGEHLQPSSNGSGHAQPPLAERSLLPLLLHRQQQQQSDEVDNSELLQWIQEQQEEDRERGGAGGEGDRERGGAGREEGGRDGARPSGAQGPPFQPPAWQQRVREAIGQQRAQFASKLSRVPGSSDSGQSSDELFARRARIQKKFSESSVPSPPPSNLTTYSKFHEAIMTASSDSSSEAQVIPGSVKKESTRTQKVPQISGMRKLRIDQKRRAAEAITGGQDNPPNGAGQPLGTCTSSQMETETESSHHQGEQESHGSSTEVSLQDGTEGARGSHQSAGEEEGLWSRGEESAAASRGQESQPEGAQHAGGIPMTMSEGSSPEEREGTRNLPRPPTDTETLNEPDEYVHSCSHPRVRRGAVQQWKRGVGYSSSEDTDESHFQWRGTAAPPTSGTDTDITTEYAGTQTTSSSASAGSDSASFTATSGDRQSGSADSDVPSQTLPLNSTPEDSGMMPPPAALRMLTPKRKRSSDETMTSISTATSSSSVEKVKGQCKHPSASLESITETDIPMQSQELSLESLEQTPFVLDSQTTPDEPRQQPRERDPSEVIPNTPPEGEQIELPPAHSNSTCQELFQESQDLANQLPQWCDKMAVESQGEEEERQQPRHKRPISQESSSPSSSEHSRSPAPPPPKRRRTQGSNSSSDIPIRGSREGSSTRSSLGPSMQAQPSSIHSSLSPGLKKHDSRSHSSSKSGSIVKHDSDRVGSGSGSCSSSSSYACSSASSGGHISQEVSSSSGGSAEGSLNRSMSSDGLSGSSGSKGSGSGSQKGTSGSSNGGHDADESTVSSIPRQTPPSLELEDLGDSEMIPQSESESCLKPQDSSPRNVAGMSSSGRSSGSAEARTTLSTSVPVDASIEVIEESVPEDVERTDAPMHVAPGVPVPPPHLESERVHSSSWQLQLSSSSASSRPLDSHTASQPSVGRKKPFEPPLFKQGDKRLEEFSEAGVEQQTSSELLPEMPGSPELLQTVCGEGRVEEEEQMQDSPEIDLQAPVNMPPPGHDPLQHVSSSTPDQSQRQASRALSLLAASSRERDTTAESMEADFSHEVSTQNSFALHYTQSQTSALTPSGVLSPCKHGEPNSSQASLKPGGISYEGLEEFEDHESEFPNLVDKDRQKQQSLERSVGEEGISESQKQSDRSETSLTSSSSQSGKSGSGPDSTPPENGGGGGGGVGESMSGSGEGGESEDWKCDGGGDKRRDSSQPGEKDDGKKESKMDQEDSALSRQHNDTSVQNANSTKTYQNERCTESELKTVATATSHDHMQATTEPTTAMVRIRPVPTYESLQCEGSNDDMVMNHHKELLGVQPAPTPALISEAGQEGSHNHVQATTESTTAMITVRPVPAYESLQCEGSAEDVVINHHKELLGVQPAPTPALISEAGQEGSQGGVNSQAMRPPTAESQHSLEITPSGTPFHFQLPQGGLLRPRVCITTPSQRLRSSLPSPMDSNSPLFRPPLHTHVVNLRGENSASGSIAVLSPSELNFSLFRPITPSQSQQSAGGLESQNATSLVSSATEEKQSGVLMNTSQDNGCPEPQQTSRQQSICTVNNLVTQPITVTAAGNESSSGVNSEQSSPQEPEHPTASQHSSSSNSEPSMISSSTRQQVTTPTSPRKSLSLRKIRNSPAQTSSVKLQSTSSQPGTKPLLIPNGITGESTGPNHAAGFMLGVHSQHDMQSETEQNVCESQLLLPSVNIPSDSQFEPSESSQFSLSTFRIERPPNENHQVSIPPPSVTRKPGSNAAASRSFFSNLKAGTSSRKKTSSLATAVSSTNRNHSTLVYEFDSQSQDSERTPFVRNSSKQARGNTLRRGGGGGGGGESRECVNSESAVNCSGSSESDMENGSMDIDDAGIPGANPGKFGHTPSPPLQDAAGCAGSQDKVGCEESPSGASSSQSDVVRFSTLPAGQTQTQVVPSSISVNAITTTNLSQHQHSAANPLPDVSSSSGMEPTSSTVASPSLSMLHFTSPSAVVASMSLERWVKQQVGGQRNRYEIQHVLTYRTIVEHRVLSSQVIEDGQVVGESEKVWQVQSEPRYCQEEALQVISPNDPTALTSVILSSTSTTSPAIAASVMSPTTLQPLQSPAASSLTATPMISKLSASNQTSSSSLSMGLHTSSAQAQSTGSTTPQVHPQASLPPVRLVQPVSQSADPGLASPGHQQVKPLAMATSESQSLTNTSTGTVHAQVQDTLLEENPIPCLSAQTRLPVSSKPGSLTKKKCKGRKGESGESMVTKRIQTRSGGRKLASPLPPHDKKRQVEERATTPQRRQTRSTTSTPSKSTPLSSPATRARGGRPPRGKSTSPWCTTPHTRSSKPPVAVEQQHTRHEELIPGPSGTHALLSSSPSISHSSSSIQVGRQVVARWSDKHWYLATVTGEVKNGKCHVKYADGDKANVSVSNMFPVECVRKDVPVTALSVPEEGLQEVSGLFSGFVESERNNFKIAVSGGEEEETCWTSRMTLPPESAQMCLQCMVSMSRGGRKRRCSSEEERSIVKKRRITVSPQHPSYGVEKGLPPQWSLFEGYTFLLTLRPKDEASPPPDPVDKDFISSQIRSRRGKILNTITNERIIDGRFFVVSDNHCRTVKYLLGLALAVPCVSYDWVKECIEQGCVVDYRPYRLPAGVPLGSDTPIPWHPRGRSSVLRGVNVYISGSDSFKHQWSPILHRAGATHFSKLPSCHQIARSEEGSSLLGDMVVICEAVSNSLLRLAKNVGMKLLNPQWIVQCLIQGKRLENYKDFWFNSK